MEGMLARLSDKRLVMLVVPVLLLLGLAIDNSFGLPESTRVGALVVLGAFLLVLAGIAFTMEETYRFDAGDRVLALDLHVLGRCWRFYEVGYDEILCMSVQGRMWRDKEWQAGPQGMVPSAPAREEDRSWLSSARWCWNYWPVAVLRDGTLVVLGDGTWDLGRLNANVAAVAAQVGISFTPGQSGSQGYVTFDARGERIFLQTELTTFDRWLQHFLTAFLIMVFILAALLLFNPEEWHNLVFW
jgi:hypothetical protein